MAANPINSDDLLGLGGTNDLLDALNQKLTATKAEMTELANLAKEYAKALGGGSSSGNNHPGPKPEEVKALNEAYKALLAEYGLYKNAIAEVTSISRDQTAIQKLQEQYANSAAGSYNKLSAEYRLLKIAMNEMGTEGEANVAMLDKMKKKAAELYDQMNTYQKATGKFTLQVGDYTRATNGLQLSFNQITRELPSLTNSMSQFAIAISNNIPLFTDAIARYSEGHKKAKAQMAEFVAQGMTEAQAMAALGDSAQFLQGTFKALLGTFTKFAGWIGIISAVIPAVTKAIEKHRKAQKEANGETKEAISLQEQLKKIYTDIDKTVNSSVSELRTLYRASQDNKRATEDRIAAAQTLKREYADAFENYSAEEIALGKATDAYNRLTDALVLQARAKAYLNKITELESKRIELESESATRKQDIAKAQEQLDKAGADYMSRTGGYSVAPWDAVKLAKANKALEEAKSSFRSVDKDLQEVDNTMLELYNRFKAVNDEAAAFGGKGAGSGAGAKAGKDYFTTFWTGVLESIESDPIREQALAAFKIDTEIAKYREQLATQTDLTADDIRNINGIIANLEEERGRKTLEIEREYASEANDALTEHRQKALQEVEKSDADILSEDDKFFKDSVASLNAYYNRLDDEAVANNDNLLRRRNAQIENEKKYWSDYRQLLIDTGRWTEEFEKDYEAKIAALTQESKDKTPKGLWGVIGYAFNVEIPKDYQKTISEVFSTAIDYTQEYISNLQDLAEQAVETAEIQVEAAKEQLDLEQEARANGYANNVELARKEYEEKLAIQKKAQQESERLAVAQELVNTATQVSNLITATSAIWAAEGIKGILGVPGAIAATAAMWTAFAAAKVTALAVTKYGDGMSEYLDYGGSHASGNDIDFGTMKDGTRRRVERGEVIGVINKRNVAKYGASRVRGIIDSLNSGTFENRYGNAFSGLSVVGASTTANLSKLEDGVEAIRKQGDYRETYSGNKRIIQYKNLKQIITND